MGGGTSIDEDLPAEWTWAGSSISLSLASKLDRWPKKRITFFLRQITMCYLQNRLLRFQKYFPNFWFRFSHPSLSLFWIFLMLRKAAGPVVKMLLQLYQSLSNCHCILDKYKLYLFFFPLAVEFRSQGQRDWGSRSRGTSGPTMWVARTARSRCTF